MKILITNNAIAYRSGSELYVQEIAQALVARGHAVAAFSTQVGDLGEKMKKQGVIVVDDLDQLGWVPDIIHAQHHLETMIALAYFPFVPAVYFCHGWKPWQEAPPLHPQIVEYKAVDSKTRDLAIKEHGVPADNISIMHNFVDLERFKKRASLPEKPQRALVFSNYADENNFLPYIQKACAKAGIPLDVVGASSGNPVDRPEDVIGKYDLIFSVGRSSLEALASGVSVVICGVWGVGPLVTLGEVERLRDQNFGVAAMYADLDADIIYKEICRYNANDAQRVTQYLRERVGLGKAVDSLEKLYTQVMETYDPKHEDAGSCSQAQAKYLRNMAIFLKQNIQDASTMQGQVHRRDSIIQQKDVELSQKNMEIKNNIQEIALIKSSKFWKMRDRYLAIKNIFKK